LQHLSLVELGSIRIQGGFVEENITKVAQYEQDRYQSQQNLRHRASTVPVHRKKQQPAAGAFNLRSASQQRIFVRLNIQKLF
jgi:hypothetical protein